MRIFIKKLVLIIIFIPILTNAMPSNETIHALAMLNKWNDEMIKKNLVSHDMQFDKSFVEFKDINIWFNTDSKIDEKDRFYKLATDSSGAIFYLWFYPELKGEPPVVVITLSDGSADNVTDNMTDFSCSFILGETLSGENLYNLKPSNIVKIKQYKTEMLNTLNCTSKTKSQVWDSIKHPKFNEWLDKLDVKYEN